MTQGQTKAELAGHTEGYKRNKADPRSLLLLLMVVILVLIVMVLWR